MEKKGLTSQEGQKLLHEGTGSANGENTLLTVDEVAKFLRLKPETIRSMAEVSKILDHPITRRLMFQHNVASIFLFE
jgi:hypothetical protein